MRNYFPFAFYKKIFFYLKERKLWNYFVTHNEETKQPRAVVVVMLFVVLMSTKIKVKRTKRTIFMFLIKKKFYRNKVESTAKP